MRILTYLFFLAMNFSVFAEMINGPANLRVVPKGEVAICLDDEVQVYVDEREGDWFKIIFVAYVSKDKYRLTKTIKAGVELFDYRGESIGKIINPFSDFEYFENGGQVGLFITLYTYKSNIVKSSILEDEVVGLINSNNLNRSSLLNLQYLKIEKWTAIEGYQGGIVMEPLTGGPFPPGIRFIFFFQNQEVVAFAGNNKMNGLDFECLGKTEIVGLRLTVYYLEEQIYFKKEAFEESIYVAFSRMH